VLLSSASQYNLDSTSYNKLIQDSPNRHRILGTVFDAEHMTQDKLTLLFGRCLVLERKIGDHYFEEFEHRFVELLWCGLILQ